MPLPLSVNPTVPVGDAPVIVAVNVTPAPDVDGLSELVTAVDVGGGAAPAVQASTSVMRE